MYDVFICYSNKDVTWVKGLLEELEKRGFVCCVDFKDFIPGAAIVENISQAIYCSRKTVAVLTPDFVNSEWCNHELQKALQRLHSHQVVPVMLRSCTVPLILQGTSYLDWENCHVKPNFWPMLEKALRLPSNNCINSVKNNSSWSCDDHLACLLGLVFKEGEARVTLALAHFFFFTRRVYEAGEVTLALG